jgi:hypothetical protein
MCCAIEFDDQLLYFKDAPTLPVLRRDGGVEWVPWGVPYGSDAAGLVPGACARHESILAGKWRHLNPRPVRILCSAFMERDSRRTEHWFPIDETQAIQGALIVIEHRHPVQHGAIVYVVTEPADTEMSVVHDRQPRRVPITT